MCIFMFVSLWHLNGNETAKLAGSDVKRFSVRLGLLFKGWEPKSEPGSSGVKVNKVSVY